MPVSSPSYFPSVRGTDQIVGLNAGIQQTGARVFLAGSKAGAYSDAADIIVVGDNAGGNNSTYPLTSAHGHNGAIIIGSGAFPNGANCSGGTFTNFSTECTAPLVIGYKGLGALVGIDGTNSVSGILAIGHNTAPNWNVGNVANDQNIRNILIGHNVWQGLEPVVNGGSYDNVYIGYLAGYTGIGSNSAGSMQFYQNVVIGSMASLQVPTNGTGLSRCVYIGHQAAGNQSIAAAEPALDNVAIGYQAGYELRTGASPRGTQNAIIGSGADVWGGWANTVMGYQAGGNMSGGNVCLGFQATTSGSTNVIVGASASAGSGSSNIILGWQGSNGLTNPSNILMIGTWDGATKRTAMYADMNAGNVALGKDVTGDAFGGTASENQLKLLNGVKGDSNPVNGGYFYVSGGSLHWVGSSGTDTIIAAA